MKVAALDLGTNTFILLVAEVENGAVTKVLHDEVRVVRLGQDVNRTRQFHPEALARAEDCFASFAQTIKTLQPEKVLACATSAARDVTNGQALLELGRHYGIPIRIVSGETEAELTFHGTKRMTSRTTPESSVLIIDVGGGSTEFILGDASGIRHRQSLDIGSVRLTELFVTKHPVPPTELKSMKDFIETKIDEAELPFEMMRGHEAIAVAGTPTTIATIDQGLPFESERVDGYRIPISKMKSWAEKLASLTIDERRALAGMEPKRADVIVAGALILQLAGEKLAIRDYIVSTRGLRYGVARFLGANREGELK